MRKNTGKPYEKFVQSVFEAVSRLEGLETVRVEASRVFDGNTLDEDGKPIPHEVDVHWQFTLNSQTYTTVIQAKDWGSPVKKEHMMSFGCVVRDIGNNHTNGIFVARSGFQRGAISWANAKGLSAAELRHIFAVEKENRVETIVVDVTAEMPKLAIKSFDIPGWFEALSEEDRKKVSGTQIGLDPNFTPVCAESGQPLGTLTNVIDCNVKKCGQGNHLHIQHFDPPVCFQFRDDLPPVKMTKITAEVTIHLDKFQIVIHQPLTHILRSVTGDDSYFVSQSANGSLVVKKADGLPAIGVPRPRSSW